MRNLAFTMMVGMFFMGGEAFAQRCNQCSVTSGSTRVESASVSLPARRTISNPRPNSSIEPSVHLTCVETDLYNFRAYVHRFASTNECRIARKDALRRGKFCDNGALFNRRGTIVNNFDSQSDCLSLIR